GILIGEPLSLEVGELPGTYLLRGPEGEDLVRGKVGETVQGGGVIIEVTELLGNPGTEFTVTKRRPLDAVTVLQQELKVAEQGRESGTLQVAYEHTNPALAEAVVEKVVGGYVRQNVGRSSAEAAAQLQF